MTRKQRDAETKAQIEADMWPDAYGSMPEQGASNPGPNAVRGRDLLAALTKKK